jgi:hypothetical protein
MKYKINLALFLFGVLSFQPAFPQQGFSEPYDFGAQAAVFTNCILQGDTVVITGAILPQGSNQWSAMLARIDTNGLLIDLHYYPDTMGDQFSQLPNYGIIQTSDKGYLMCGSLVYASDGAVLKTDSVGNLEFYKVFAGEKSFKCKSGIEIENGYLVIGSHQRSNYFLDVVLLKLDKDGNKLWERNIGDWDLDDGGGGILALDSNLFVVIGENGIGNASNLNNTFIRSKAWFVDSLGNVLDEWESEKNVESGILGLKILPDKSWLYCSRTYEVLSPDEWGGVTKLVRRDTNMNLMWERLMPHATTINNLLYDITPTADGNWVAIGHWIPYYEPFNPDTIAWMGGVIHKFSSDGDSIWTVLDSVFWDQEYGSYNRLGGVVALPSGSVIAVGSVMEMGTVFKSWAWMVKADKDGCIDTLCLTTHIPVENLSEKGGSVRVYPNPGDREVQFAFEGLIEEEVTVSVVNTLGRIVFKAQLDKTAGYIDWNTTNVPTGVYVFTARSQDGRVIEHGQVIVQH